MTSLRDFTLELFDQVPASAGRTLLRLVGRLTPGTGAPVALLAEDGPREWRLPALPGPGPERGRWAFAAPTELVEREGAAWSLELDDGTALTLPRPVPWQRDRTRPVVAPARGMEAALRDARAEAERLREERDAAVAHLEAVAEYVEGLEDRLRALEPVAA